MMLPGDFPLGVPCRLSVPARVLTGVDLGVVLGDGTTGLAAGFLGLGEVRLIDGETCRGPLSEGDSSKENE